MGTNFYIKRESNYCDCCGRSDAEEFHIGKQVGIGCGRVGFVVDPDFFKTDDADAFIKQISLSIKVGWKLVDEYGREYPDASVFEQHSSWALGAVGGFS